MFEASLLLGLVGVAPEDVDGSLVALRLVLTQLDLEWSLNLIDLIKVLEGGADTTVAAEDSLLLVGNDGCEGQLV